MKTPVHIKPRPAWLPMLRQVAVIPLHWLKQIRYAKQVFDVERITFGPHNRQYLLHVRPHGHIANQSLTIVYWHGGGWHASHPAAFPAVLSWFAERGYSMIMPAYRLAPLYNHAHMREDIDLALQKTMELVAPDARFVFGGMSAGATLAAHAALDTERLQAIGFPADKIKGLLCSGGPLDLNGMPDTLPLRRYTGGAHFSAAFDEANPVRFVPNHPPLDALLIHGDADAIVPIACSQRFAAEARQYGYPVQVEVLPGMTHLDALLWTTVDQKTSAIVENWLRERA